MGYGALRLKGLTLQLNSIGCLECRPRYLENLKSYYSSHADSLCPDCRARFSRSPLRLLDCKNTSCQGAVAGAPRTLDCLCQPCHSHFEELRSYLDRRAMGYELNPHLVRGLDYYTRTVFEIQPAEVRGQSALGGGGRYDNLIEQVGGRPTPAVGFATGLERIVANLKDQGITPQAAPASQQVFVVSADEAGEKEAPIIAAAFHEANISASSTSGDYSLKSQMRQADSSGSRWVVIIGSTELSRDSVVLRDMAAASQQEMPLSEAIARIKGATP